MGLHLVAERRPSREIQASVDVLVNGTARTVPADCTVSGLLTLLGLGERRLAVALNRTVVPRSGYPTQRLGPGDRVEILEAVGGG